MNSNKKFKGCDTFHGGNLIVSSPISRNSSAARSQAPSFDYEVRPNCSSQQEDDNFERSLDLFRRSMQNSINKEIDGVIENYMTKFFVPFIDVLRRTNDNISENIFTTIRRQILEDARNMYEIQISSNFEQSANFNANLQSTNVAEIATLRPKQIIKSEDISVSSDEIISHYNAPYDDFNPNETAEQNVTVNELYATSLDNDYETPSAESFSAVKVVEEERNVDGSQLETIIRRVIKDELTPILNLLTPGQSKFKQTTLSKAAMISVKKDKKQADTTTVDSRLGLLLTEHMANVRAEVQKGFLDERIKIDWVDFTEDVEALFVSHGSDPYMFARQLAWTIFGPRQLRWRKLTSESAAVKDRTTKGRSSVWNHCPQLAKLWHDIMDKYYEKICAPLLRNELQQEFLRSNSLPQDLALTDDNLNDRERRMNAYVEDKLYASKTSSFAMWIAKINQSGQDSGRYSNKPQNVLYWRLVDTGYKPNDQYKWEDDVFVKEYMAMKYDRQNKKVTKAVYSERSEEGPRWTLDKIRQKQKEIYLGRHMELFSDISQIDSDVDDKIYSDEFFEKFPRV